MLLAVRETSVVSERFESSVNREIRALDMGALDELNRTNYTPDVNFHVQENNCIAPLGDTEEPALKRLEVEQKWGETKVLCVVYSASRFHDRLQATRETWAPSCDGFFVASDQTDPSLNAVNIPHVENEEYGNMWQKARSIWSFIYQTYTMTTIGFIWEGMICTFWSTTCGLL